ncbi:hypothetical protein [Chloroflexus aggregans]|uniref:Uncharacterized protein n=1 Tax=Chloroflexus aggregans (strain MD-66 / DSM 9485) TaxID=326427 RepID=B8G7E7_CHLAD|nr:hypothetical protein [Chloroflexus aggregans]ACL25982.1 hypothetical protein Cagg_3124 [Chloroflexus aggregans DSM 9485]
MPSGLGEATQMIGPLTPVILCWACLILTVLGLGLTFIWTNVTAYARRTRNGRKPTAGSVVKSQR